MTLPTSPPICRPLPVCAVVSVLCGCCVGVNPFVTYGCSSNLLFCSLSLAISRQEDAHTHAHSVCPAGWMFL